MPVCGTIYRKVQKHQPQDQFDSDVQSDTLHKHLHQTYEAI